MLAIGIDGCRQGWVMHYHDRSGFHFKHIDSLSQLNTHKPQASIICVDMPLKLATHRQHYPRQCDRQAKRVLGKKHSSIFYAPLSQWLKNKSYEQINRQAEALGVCKLSKQSYFLLPKIKELQEYLKLKPKTFTLYEGHPELFFVRHKPNILSKKTSQGLKQRLEILRSYIPQRDFPNWSLAKQASRSFCEDDLTDSLSMCVLAKLIQAEQAGSLGDSQSRIFY